LPAYLEESSFLDKLLIEKGAFDLVIFSSEDESTLSLDFLFYGDVPPKMLSVVVDFLKDLFFIVFRFFYCNSGSGLKIWLLLIYSCNSSGFSLFVADF